MTDYRSTLERSRDAFPPPEMPLGDVLRRRDRKRRNQRIVAGVVGLAIAAAAVLAGASLLQGTRRSAGPTERAPVLRREGEIALKRDRGESGENLVGVDPKTGATRTLASCSDLCHGIGDFAWSPDGRWIAFTIGTCVTITCWESEAGIWVKGADAEPRQIMSRCFGTKCNWVGDSSFTWAPDGSRLVYVQPGATGSEIFNVAPDGSDRIRLAASHGAFSSVQWSPDGSHIAYLLAGQVYVMDPDGAAQTRLTTSLPGVDSLNWSPDGGRLVLNATEPCCSRIYTVASDGSSLRLLLDEPTFEGPSLPVWSPDGTRLAFVRTPGEAGNYTVQFWVMNADGSEQTKVYQSAGNESWDGPIWSPDGSNVAFGILDGSDQGWYSTSARGTGTKSIDELVALGWRQGA